MSAPELGVVAPFWLDRPDTEAVEIAEQAARHGYSRMWLGEMATFDAFALATAVGLAAPGLPLTIGPLAVGVRSPVALALGAASVATLTGASVDLALGASSPTIVAEWHGRDWSAPATRTRAAIGDLRRVLAGERLHGFRLRTPLPDARVAVAAFGPAMTRVAAQLGDAVILNLVAPEHVARTRASTRSREIDVWVPAAVDPGDATLRQLAAQIAVYLAPPGYGELFAALGFGQLVARARAGARRAELVDAVPRALLETVCALGSRDEVRARLAAYGEAGAAHVGVVPATAEDPAGARTLGALAP